MHRTIYTVHFVQKSMGLPVTIQMLYVQQSKFNQHSNPYKKVVYCEVKGIA